MQVDDFSQYTDEEIEELERLVKVKDHTFGPGPSNREDRRQQQIRLMRNRKRKGRNLGGAKVRR